MAKKFYWLKLQKDFYKRHDIKYIESLPNGIAYLWFYMKLLLESIDHEGELRFNDMIPYDEYMLSSVTGTNVDIVKGAMELFIRLQMIKILEDKTIYMEQVASMIGNETDSAERVRKHRELKNSTPVLIPEVIEEQIESEAPKETKKTKHKYGVQYKHVLLTEAEYEALKSAYEDADQIINFLDSYIEEKGYKAKSHYLTIRRWVVEAYRKQTRMNPTKRVEPIPDYDQGKKEMSPEELEALRDRLSKMGYKKVG